MYRVEWEESGGAVQGAGCRVQGSGCRVQGSGCARRVEHESGGAVQGSQGADGSAEPEGLEGRARLRTSSSS